MPAYDLAASCPGLSDSEQAAVKFVDARLVLYERLLNVETRAIFRKMQAPSEPTTTRSRP